MELFFCGWRRHVRSHVLIDLDISGLELSENRSHSRGEAYIESPEHHTLKMSGLDVVAKAQNVSLNGDYYVRVTLTKEEIANLARIGLRNDPFGDVIAALSKRQKIKRLRKK
jgi:hypothetical protein